MLTSILDDDVDRQRFDAADAKHIIQLLAHRGDGDWFLHYRQGKIGLPLLREARDYPGAKIIERALGELAIPSAKDKGKGRAIDSLDHDDIAVESGQRATIYSGVSPFSDYLPITIYIEPWVGYIWKIDP